MSERKIISLGVRDEPREDYLRAVKDFEFQFERLYKDPHAIGFPSLSIVEIDRGEIVHAIRIKVRPETTEEAIWDLIGDIETPVEVMHEKTSH